MSFNYKHNTLYSHIFCSSKAAVIIAQHFPSSNGHEAWGELLTLLGHLSHAGARDKVKETVVHAGEDELHLLVALMVGSDLEGEDLNTIEHLFHVDEELLSVPDIVAVLGAIGVLNTSGVTASNEVGDTAADAGAGVPEYLGGSTVVHW